MAAGCHACALSKPVPLADGGRADLILIGESGVATAIAGLACPTAASLAWLPRSAVLGSAATTVVRLAETLCRGDTRDGCPLASQRLSMVLGLAFAGSALSRPHSGEPKSRRPQSYWQRPQAPPSVCSFHDVKVAQNTPHSHHHDSHPKVQVLGFTVISAGTEFPASLADRFRVRTGETIAPNPHPFPDGIENTFGA